MKIVRRGSTADHGPNEIVFNNPKFKWLSTKSSLVVTQGRTKDFTSGSHHTYRIEIDASELVEIFQSIGEGSLTDPLTIERDLCSALKSVLQIAAALTGLRAVATSDSKGGTR